jgi:hypothetical protein
MCSKFVMQFLVICLGNVKYIVIYQREGEIREDLGRDGAGTGSRLNLYRRWWKYIVNTLSYLAFWFQAEHGPNMKSFFPDPLTTMNQPVVLRLRKERPRVTSSIPARRAPVRNVCVMSGASYEMCCFEIIIREPSWTCRLLVTRFKQMFLF